MSIDLLNFECDNEENINLNLPECNEENNEEQIKDYFIDNDIINNLNNNELSDIKLGVDKIVDYFIKELESKNAYINELEEAIRILNLSNSNINQNQIQELEIEQPLEQQVEQIRKRERELEQDIITYNENEIIESQNDLFKILKEKRANENVKKRKATIRF